MISVQYHSDGLLEIQNSCVSTAQLVDYPVISRVDLMLSCFFFNWLYSPVTDLRLLLFFGSLIYLDIQ
jgi:hypothetical protein